MLKKIGIAIFLMIALIGMSTCVSAGGEGDKVGEPNTLAIVFINTYHGHGVAVNGIQFTRQMWNMAYAVHIITREYDENGTKIAGRNVIQGACSDDFIERFKPDTKNIRFSITANMAAGDDPDDFDFSWIIPVDGSHYGGACINCLGGLADNFRLVGNHYDTDWKRFT
jgi:hypothetical protein